MTTQGRDDERARWEGRIEARLDAVEADVRGIHKAFETVISRLGNIETSLASLKSRVAIVVGISGFVGAILANWLVNR